MVSAKSKNYVILLLALATIAGAVLAWNQYLELIKLRAGGLDAKERADLQKRLWDLEKRNNELQAENANLRARGTAVADDANPDGAAPQGGAPAGPGRFNRRNGFGNISTLLDNPEFNKLWTQQQKDRVKIAYAGLFKSLKLTPDQADKMNGLLVEQQSSVMDVLSAARAQGIMGRDQISSLLQQANSQIDGQIQALLGPDGYAQYTNYVQTMPQQTQVNELQTRLAAAGVQSLQDFQSQQLTQILAQNAQPGGNGQRGGGGGAGFLGGMGALFGQSVTGPTITPTAVTQAATVLTPEQLQALQQMQQEQAAQQQILSLLRQSFSGSSGRGAAAATTGQTTPAPARPPTRTGG
jgi:hypothetical protein